MVFNAFITYTICLRNSYPFYKVTYYIKRVTTSWTDNTYEVLPFYLITGE